LKLEKLAKYEGSIMRKATLSGAGGRFELKEQPIPEPGRGCVRVKVQACGICHSDALTKDGTFPGIVYPRSPSHEIAGMIDALGAGTEPWKVGDRVGVG
jgi:D-arabinose 1-dehydrogenase-like Zn-dependent alcohol dehydrogenase